MRGETIIRPRPSKYKKHRDREFAKRAKEALARAASMSEGLQKQPIINR